MSISRQTLSVVIVSFKSENVIYDCIKSIPNELKIIVVDNANDKKFRETIENEYNNVKCVLSSSNLGMGSGNNLGLKYVKTDYAIILNPDVILESNALDEIITASKNIESFAILAPLSTNKDYPNYKIDKKTEAKVDDKLPFKVKSVDGYAMVLNLKKINQIENFKNSNFFDENIFMYLENDDVCKRIIDNNENIFVIPSSKINHLGAKGVNEMYAYEVELSRNWHWIWSKFYFNKKHYGFLFAFFHCFPGFLSSIIKFLFYSVLLKHKKKKIHLQRIKGFINALLGKKSSYRPEINNY